MEVFNYCPLPGMTVDNEPAVNEVQFNDGYVQRRPKGINNLLRKYPATFKVRNEKRLDVDAFFMRHGGYLPFLWQDPYSGKQVKVICSKWSAKMGRTHTEFSCEIKETR
ncbi:phage tail protein [Testudinibacter sp. P80/BLE/0925]|uniref:phage tail protein n=1 Tax=Testudinibacter sp. TW-1 TaxID=3417757 RepID=UPI003D36632A